ncbi:MAG TPA: glucose-6-phosphate dehydrogenase assembly protein OpcA [Candidatus Dormibacteraeota bacterium]|jgi:glucose-6-phosphate dehydrogenase assembly protein OpcA
MVTLSEDRVRVRRWGAHDVDLPAVVARLHELQAELTRHDGTEQEHPHPRNCVLNLVVMVEGSHRIEAADRAVASLAAGHPLRAILIHLHGGRGTGGLDAEITSEAHRLVTGFPVQREQILLHVRGEVTRHVSSLVEPLLVSDVPTYLWWSGRQRLDEATIRDAMTFADVLVVDSARFEHPVDSLLELAHLVADPEVSNGVADFRWSRLRPWRDAIGQFFAPEHRFLLLADLQEVVAEAAGSGPDARVGAALMAGWAAAGLGWRFVSTSSAGEDATEAVADADGHQVHLTLRSVSNAHLHHGELMLIRLTGKSGRRAFTFTMERDQGGDPHGHVTIELGSGPPVRQRLTLPRMGDPDLLVHVLWANQRDPVLHGALQAAVPLLETMR